MTSILGTAASIPYGLMKFTSAGFNNSTSRDEDTWENIYIKSNKDSNEYTRERVPDPFIDLSGKTYLVTGANSGIGYSSALYFAQHKATVHIICRNAERGREAIKSIKSETKNKSVYLHVVDMGEPEQIRQFARRFAEEGNHLDVLVNNASAMMAGNEIEYNSDNIEKTLAINTVGTFLLTNLLIPLIQKSEDGRVIVVSSGGQLTQKLVIKDDWFGNSFDPMVAYARTKRHLTVLSELWAERYSKGLGIKVFSMHPGLVDTKAVKISMPTFYRFMKNKLRTVEEGSDTIKWLAVSEQPKLEQSGSFFRDREIESKHIPLAQTNYTHDEAEELWNWCCQLSGWYEGNQQSD